MCDGIASTFPGHDTSFSHKNPTGRNLAAIFTKGSWQWESPKWGIPVRARRQGPYVFSGE